MVISETRSMLYHCFTDVGIWASLGNIHLETELHARLHTTLGEIARLHSAVADITPQLWHDVTPQLRSSAKRWMVELT